jgi:hypothetical protein
VCDAQHRAQSRRAVAANFITPKEQDYSELQACNNALFSITTALTMSSGLIKVLHRRDEPAL